MVIRLLVCAVLGWSLVACPAARADERLGIGASKVVDFEADVSKLVGTLRKRDRQEQEAVPGVPPVLYFIDSGAVSLRVDFSGDADLEKRAAGLVGKKVSVKGRAEYRVKPKYATWAIRPDTVELVVIAAEVSPVGGK